MLSTRTAGRIILAMAIMAALAGKAFPQAANADGSTAQAFPQAAPASSASYRIDGAKVSMLATCDGDGLTIEYGLTATSLAPKTITIHLSYSGYFDWAEWTQMTPIPDENNPIRSAQWRPAYIGQHARILLDGGAPCDTVIGELTSLTARRYTPRFAR